MRTSKKLLSVLLTFIMTFSLMLGGLTTAFAAVGDATQTTITASPTSIVADGSSTSTITVQVKDSTSANVTTGGDTVTLSVYDGTSQTPLTVTDDTYGTYTATYTSSTTEGTATISGTLNGTAITNTALITLTPAAPSVTNDDTANTVTGMAVGMEYNLDAVGYVVYDAIPFDAIDFSGNHTLLVRVAAEGINPASADTTLTFTINPPAVTADDANNVILGADATMEYSIDAGVMWDLYDIATPPTFPGVVTVEVRVAANAGTGTPAGDITSLTFTAVGDITGNNILLIGDYAFDLSDPLNNKYDLNNFLVAANTAYLNPVTKKYEVYFRIGDAWYDISSDSDMSNQITDLTEINGGGLYTYMNMQ